MGNIPEIVSYMEFGRTELLKSIEGLSNHELGHVPIYDDWTVKDVLAHIIGWDQHVLKILPLILQNRADEITWIDVEAFNRRSITAWQARPLAEVLETVKSTHQQIVDIISSLDHVEIDMRRDRLGQTITIRGYVIDILVEHERHHAVDIEQWRAALDQSINPPNIKKTVDQTRARLMAAVEGLDEVDLLDETTANGWSVKDVVGHIAAWEELMLIGARHICDPSQPTVTPLTDNDNLDDWNEVIAAQLETRSWSEIFLFLQETRQALNEFLAELKWNDWKRRGPYPWPNDQGTLAELITGIAEHDTDHLPDLERWQEERK